MQPQKPVVMELIEVPQMVAPPPAAVEELTPPDPVKPPLVNPDPVVQPPAPSPSPMLAAIRPPKTEAVAAAPATAAEGPPAPITPPDFNARSEEHTSTLQSLMRISYAVFCLKKKHTIRRMPTKL